MIQVLVYKQSNYPVSGPQIKKNLREFLTKNGIVSDALVSVALVGREKMLELSKKFMKDKLPHNVLSFPAAEVRQKFVAPKTIAIDLGEIVVCCPIAIEEAKREGKLLAEKVLELVNHGALHLLGIHHE